MKSKLKMRNRIEREDKKMQTEFDFGVRHKRDYVSESAPIEYDRSD